MPKSADKHRNNEVRVRAGKGALIAAFKDRYHDLVVPTDSALAFGAKEPVLTCSHVHYFLQPEVRTAIQNFCPPPAPVVVPPQPAVHQKLDVASDHVKIGDISFPRQPKPDPMSSGQEVTTMKLPPFKKTGEDETPE